MKKGFTIIELGIVVIIIGLLAAMAIPAFQKVKQASEAKSHQQRVIDPDFAPIQKPIVPQEITIDGKRYRLLEIN